MRTRRGRCHGPEIDRPRLAPARVDALERRRLLSIVVVNTTADQTDPAGTATVSLRDAVADANASQTQTFIEFDPTVFATEQAITLDGTPLELSNTGATTTIQGPSAGLLISGDFQSNVFTVDSGVSAGLAGLTLEQGSNPDGFGGGLENRGTVAVTDCTIVSNSAYDGAGIYNYGSLYLYDSTVEYNDASIGNGGIGSTGTATLIDDTIYGNKSPAGTGGYGDDGTATLEEVTIADNAGDDFVGGFFTGDGDTTISNSIIAGNTGEASGVVPDVYGTFGSDGHNLIGATDGSRGWTSTDLTGTAANPLNAGLGGLADNGGPTPTAAPQAGSLALGNGSVALIPSGYNTDQRGDPRTIDGAVDIGSVEIGGTSSRDEPTTTTLRPNAYVLRVGETTDVDVSVTSNNPDLPAPTGTVSIDEDGTLLGTYTLNNGSVTEPVTPQTAMLAHFSAVYSGDAEFAPSTAAGYEIEVVPASAFVPSPGGHVAVSGSVELPGAAIRVSDPITFTNSGAKLSGPFKFAFDVDTSSVGLDADPAVLQSVQRRLTVNPNKSFSVTLGAKKLPASLTPGTYYFTAEMTDPTGAVAFSTVPTPITVVAPLVALAASATAVRPGTVSVRRAGTITVGVEDTGNTTATGTLAITVLPSSDGTSAVGTTPLATFSHHVTIRAGQTARYTLHVKVPAALAAGPYDPLASVSLDGVSTSVAGSQFTVVGVSAG